MKLGRDIDRARQTGVCLDPILVPIWETVRAVLELESATGLSPSSALQEVRHALQETQSVSSAAGSHKGKQPELSGGSSDTSASDSDSDDDEGVEAPPLIDWEEPPAPTTRPSAPPAPVAAALKTPRLPVGGLSGSAIGLAESSL